MEPLKGIQESVIKEERDYLDSKKIRTLILNGVDYPQPILNFDGAGFIFPNTINLIQGGFGTNKSYFASYLASALLNPGSAPALNLYANPEYQYTIAYLDTERPIVDQFPAAMKHLIENAGLTSKKIPENFIPGSLRKTLRKDRLRETKMFIDNAMCPSSHLVLFLDVITDCMTNFNDLTETNILLDKLNDMTENKEITVIGVIHENPDGTKKARGHIGTEFVNKATTVVSIGYKNEYSPILSLRIIKNRLVKRQKEKFIKRSEKTGLLVFADSSEIEDIQSNKRIKLSELSEMLLQKFGVGEISNKELLKFTMHQFSVSDKTSRIAINDLYENQSFLKDKGFELKRKKGMHNSNIYKLVKLEEMLDFIEPQEV